MCLTVPVKIKKINGTKAELADGRTIDVALIAKPRIGDWILANADLGLKKISAREAKEIKNYFE